MLFSRLFLLTLIILIKRLDL